MVVIPQRRRKDCDLSYHIADSGTRGKVQRRQCSKGLIKPRGSRGHRSWRSRWGLSRIKIGLIRLEGDPTSSPNRTISKTTSTSHTLTPSTQYMTKIRSWWKTLAWSRWRKTYQNATGRVILLVLSSTKASLNSNQNTALSESLRLPAIWMQTLKTNRLHNKWYRIHTTTRMLPIANHA